jgi:hypothetical protein
MRTGLGRQQPCSRLHFGVQGELRRCAASGFSARVAVLLAVTAIGCIVCIPF